MRWPRHIQKYNVKAAVGVRSTLDEIETIAHNAVDPVIRSRKFEMLPRSIDYCGIQLDRSQVNLQR